jgi:TolA-binding protein
VAKEALKNSPKLKPAPETAASPNTDRNTRQRLDELEIQFAQLNDQLTTLKTQVNRQKTNSFEQPISTVIQTTHIQEQTSQSTHPPLNRSIASNLSFEPRADAETGFINDESIQAFTQALITYQTNKYPEAILAFVAFLKNFPNHPFAGSAQYYIGDSYLKDKEYKFALQEFQQVISRYPDSVHLTDTLKRLIEIAKHLNNNNDLKQYEYDLSSLFPQSPAANTENL